MDSAYVAAGRIVSAARAAARAPFHLRERLRFATGVSGQQMPRSSRLGWAKAYPLKRPNLAERVRALRDSGSGCRKNIKRRLTKNIGWLARLSWPKRYSRVFRTATRRG